jgi:hypothetical protein
MVYGLAIGLYLMVFIGLCGFIRFCDWVLSRREANS